MQYFNNLMYALQPRHVRIIINSMFRLSPMFIVMIIFGAITGQTGIVKNANDCSCYCFPMIGNVLPNAYSRDQVSMCIIHSKLGGI